MIKFISRLGTTHSTKRVTVLKWNLKIIISVLFFKPKEYEKNK